MTTGKCVSCGTVLRADSRFCPQCGTPAPSSPPSLESSNEKIPSAASTVRHPMTRRAKLLYGVFGALILSVFSYTFVTFMLDRPHPVIERQPVIAMPTMYAGQVLTLQPIESRVANGKVIVRLNDLLEKKMVEFQYVSPLITVPLLAYISPEGKLVTSFRYCEPCGSKSFSAEGMELHCGACETKWSFVNLEGIQGSCQKYPPEPIPSEVVGDEIHIDEKLVANWKLRL